MILITGATGFIGRSVVEHLLNSRYAIRACSRQQSASFINGVEYHVRVSVMGVRSCLLPLLVF